MFEASTNDGYYDLGLKTVEIIADVVVRVQAAEGKMGGAEGLKNLPRDQVSETKHEEEGSAIEAAVKETASHGGAESTGPPTPQAPPPQVPLPQTPPPQAPPPQVAAPAPKTGGLFDFNPWA